ncbi:LysR family transcriptional regulator [Sphingomonas sp. AP4-R1]|uniref:LysR substrate-binding domain-containing protein n=1 Tax=Sphingomonas sp. AP4-R1 TaxID=2735134 RepID=UPI001493AFAA|nr:LysR substrate-binding domain-containing protein [Sphingomonas sp. AP4-R1]QJU59872.1 LysR family transcriptional regulator [Sphingomonas sp. AP4-R1]
MLRRQTPPLEATEAFLLAARAVSFRAAADELALSPSAFSRRIQLLESFVGVALFDRSGAVVQLTDAGARYFAEIAPAMDTIRRATVGLRDQAGSRTLRLMTSHSFAVGWLVPRLPDLFRAHGIEIDLSIGRDAQALRSGQADLAIWGGRPHEEDLPRERLIDLSAVLASAPRLADGRTPPASVRELGEHRILATKVPEHFWQGWLTGMGLDGRLPQPATRFETTQLTYEAAASGLGLTLAVPLISERFVADRRLLPAFGPAVPIGFDYSVFYATAEIERRAPVKIFVRWLRDQIAMSLSQFEMWVGSSDRAGDPDAANGRPDPLQRDGQIAYDRPLPGHMEGGRAARIPA